MPRSLSFIALVGAIATLVSTAQFAFASEQLSPAALAIRALEERSARGADRKGVEMIELDRVWRDTTESNLPDVLGASITIDYEFRMFNLQLTRRKCESSSACGLGDSLEHERSHYIGFLDAGTFADYGCAATYRGAVASVRSAIPFSAVDSSTLIEICDWRGSRDTPTLGSTRVTLKNAPMVNDPSIRRNIILYGPELKHIEKSAVDPFRLGPPGH